MPPPDGRGRPLVVSQESGLSKVDAHASRSDSDILRHADDGQQVKTDGPRLPLRAPAAEVRRLRAELDELRTLLTALVDALPDPRAEVEYRRQLAREAAAAERERAWSGGYAAAIADVKRTDHGLVRVLQLAGLRSAPGGPAWLAAVERNGGSEYGGAGQPRVPVAAEVIERARAVRAA